MRTVALLAAALVVGWVGPVAAQTVGVSGRVVDASGDGVAGAVVTLTGGSVRQTETTEAAGG
jgi:hypothetical protein